MDSTPNRFSARLLGLIAIVVIGGAVVGCGTGQTITAGPRYSLKHPDYWKIKQTASKDGEPTVVMIPQYGDAVIDDGAGSMAPKSQNYEGVTADVEVRLYSWGDPGLSDEPTREVARLLTRDESLNLPKHFVVPDNPPECNVYPKKYTVFGSVQTPLDLVSRPGHRTIVVGGRSSGVLMAAVARVEYEQDMGRYCHNLSNMQVQLQNLLDGLSPVGSAAGPVPPPRGLPGGGPPGSTPNGGPPGVGGGPAAPPSDGSGPPPPVETTP